MDLNNQNINTGTGTQAEPHRTYYTSRTTRQNQQTPKQAEPSTLAGGAGKPPHK